MADSQDNIETTDIDVDLLGIQPPTPVEQENSDGTTTIILGDEEPPSDGEWFQNLSTFIDQNVLDDLSEKYLELIEQDMEARKDRDRMQADGIKKSGIGGPAPGGADFEGASRVTHPVLIESYIDFAAQAIKELFPPNGPVKIKIQGKPNKTKMDKAVRKSAFMNWQLTREIPSYRPELERLLTQLPVGGSQYMKFYWSDTLDAPNVEFVPIDDMVLPFEARNFFDLQRKFHRITMSEFTYEQRVQSGLYRDLSLPAAYGGSIEPTDSQRESDRVEGKSNDYNTENRDRIVFEGCVYDQIAGDDKAPDGRAVPYLITIDEESRQVLSIYRNWNEHDDKYREIDYLVDFTFIPWRGVWGLSLLQCVGGLPDALTGSLRALLDSALISNLQGGIKLKGNPSGASLSISPTEITEIESNGQDDIRKIYMPIPFNQPSPMLFQLLGLLTGAAKEVVGSAEESISDAGNNMPVGTTLALIEQGAKVFSSIHARLHDSQRRCLEILHRLNKDHLPEGKTVYGSDDDDYVTRADFEGQLDVRPVSDPNIFSETQRFAQIQFVMQSVIQAAPVIPQAMQLFDFRALYARAFELAKIPDYEEFLPEVPKPMPMNPADENVAMVLGKPVKAYAGQNHEAHIQVLLDFAKNPMFGQSPIIAGKFITAALNHLQDHVLIWYEEMMKADAAQAVGKKVTDVDWDNDPESAVMMAKSCPVIDQATQIAFGQIPALVAQAMQQLQALAPKPPVDPMVQVEQAKIQGDQQIQQGKLSLAQQKAQADAQMKLQVLQAKVADAQQDYQLAMQKIGIDAQTQQQSDALDAQTSIRTANIQSQTDMAKTIHDNQSAQTIAAMKISADAHTKLSDGASLSE